MSALELDPLFVKALRLLHLKAKDSTDQLRQMLVDVLHSNSSTSNTDKDRDSAFYSHSSLVKKPSPKHPVETVRKSSVVKDTEEVPVLKRKEHGDHKRLVDVPDWLQDAPAKRLKIASPKPSRSPSPARVKTEDIKRDCDEDSSFDDNTDAAHIALEMGLACEVCRSFDVTPGNTLVECQDCHTLYHQECHKPPISEQDINDPRVVWYCAKCTKNLKKMASKTSKTSKTPVSMSSKETIGVLKPAKPEPAPPPTSIFKRSELKTSSSTSGTTTPPLGGNNKPIGLAALAASLSGGKPHQSVKTSQALRKGASSTSSSSSSTSSTKSTPSTSPGQSGSKLNSAIPAGITESKPSAFSVLMASTRATSPGSASSNPPGNGGLGSTSLPKALHAVSTATAVSKQTSSTAIATSSAGTLSSSSSGVKAASSSSLMSADKRLQIMKKKAAAKRHEKRKLSTK